MEAWVCWGRKRSDVQDLDFFGEGVYVYVVGGYSFVFQKFMCIYVRNIFGLVAVYGVQQGWECFGGQ